MFAKPLGVTALTGTLDPSTGESLTLVTCYPFYLLGRLPRDLLSAPAEWTVTEMQSPAILSAAENLMLNSQKGHLLCAT
jgi:hypothetical protein